MAYGRLDVFFPDGLLQTFLLTNPSTSIGRSSGNTIPLETTTISRYHISITNTDGQTYLTDLDSVNGTFVDGARLKVNMPHPLYGGEEILIGELRLLFHNMDENPTRPIVVPEEATRHIEAQQANFSIDLDAAAHSVAPGAHISTALTITNHSDEAERYGIEVEGLPKGWVRVDRPEAEVEPGVSGDVIISFKPLRRSDSTPGDYRVQVVVRPRSSPDKPMIALMTLRVLPYSGFGMALSRNHLDSAGRFRLHLHNQGSAPLTLTVTGRDLGNALRFVLPTAQVTLGPGQRTTLDGRARPRAPHLFGEARQHPFDLVVRSTDASGFLVATRAYVNESPSLPTWAAFALGGLGLALLGLIVIGLVLLLRPNPPPQIASFEVSSARIAQGSLLDLRWTVENADGVSVTVNGTPVYENLSGEGAQIDTSSLNGSVVVGLRASGGGGQVEATQVISVYTPLSFAALTVEPPQLVRYVVGSLTLQWAVTGAETTQISGLEGFSTQPLPPAYPASGEVTVSGIPTAPLVLSVVAQDGAGEIVQQQVTVNVIDPECTPLNDNTALYFGPDPSHQVVSTAPAGLPLVVDARDVTGTWLRVRLTGGLQGWGQRPVFTCADTFNVEDLQIVSDLPPTPTRLPTLTPVTPATPVSTPTRSAPPAGTVNPALLSTALPNSPAPPVVTPVAVTESVPR
jgi:pSer/pThr/pTyr-binding forkhead associated (FHA) protein